MQTHYADDLLDASDDFEEYDDLFADESADAFDPSAPAPGTTQVPHFRFGGHTLSARQRGILNGIVRAVVARLPASQAFFHCAIIEVEGHEDEVGDPARYGAVGQRRALTAARFLARRLTQAIDRLPAADRRSVEIQVTSAGPVRPVRSNVTEAGRSLNRRVEVRWRVDSCPNVT
jgi:outer membrane protein OmpA-like peptidoglycan-associated protein